MNSTLKMLALMPTLIAAACVSRAIEQRTPTMEELSNFDGAFLSYFLPQGEMTITAAFDPAKGSLTLANEGLKIVPDFKHRYFATYRHNELSIDNISIEIDTSGLLKYVGTTTTDQTAEVIRSIGAVFKEVGSLRDAAEKRLLAPDAAGTEECKAMTARTRISIDRAKKEVDEKFSGSCKLKLEASVSLAESLPASVFPDISSGEMCPQSAVCFRMSGGYTLTITAHLLRDRKRTHCNVAQDDICIDRETLNVVAPLKGVVGQLHFNRRAFVKNTTKVSFTNGMLTKIEAEDPSAIVGFLSIPIELLKSTTLFIQL